MPELTPAAVPERLTVPLVPRVPEPPMVEPLAPGELPALTPAPVLEPAVCAHAAPVASSATVAAAAKIFLIMSTSICRCPECQDNARRRALVRMKFSSARRIARDLCHLRGLSVGIGQVRVIRHS
jgi:hypothetical protein